MTTGRINQVTILTRGLAHPERFLRHRECPPRRTVRVVKRSGTSRSPCPVQSCHGAEAAEGHSNHPIAPTEFPKGRSATKSERADPEARRHTATYGPQEEDTSCPSRPKAVTSFG